MKIEESIDNSVGLEERSPQSTKLYTKISLLFSTVALLLFFLSVVTYQIDEVVGINVFSATFIPMAIGFVISLYLALVERLRAKYLGARMAVILSTSVFICIVAFVVYELIKYHQLFVAPFNPFKGI